MGLSVGIFREVWQEEAEKAKKMQEGEWEMKAIGYLCCGGGSASAGA